MGVHPQGCDDRDRPGALAFHALFVGRWAYRWAGADPFALRRGHARRLEPGRPGSNAFPRSPGPSAEPGRTSPPTRAPDDDPRLAPIVTALTQGRRVVVQSSEPIDGLARSVWRALPRSVRRRATVATWAFDNANHFDLVALPKLAGAPWMPPTDPRTRARRPLNDSAHAADGWPRSPGPILPRKVARHLPGVPAERMPSPQDWSIDRPAAMLEPGIATRLSHSD